MRCPYDQCDGAVTLTTATVHIEAGPYDSERHEYAVDYDARVMACSKGHTFVTGVGVDHDAEPGLHDRMLDGDEEGVQSIIADAMSS